MRAILLPTLAILALAASADAGHCGAYTTSEPLLDTADAAAWRWYVDIDVCQMKNCIVDTWVYEESNGIDGLQRGDEVIDDTCHGSIRADTIIF